MASDSQIRHEFTIDSMHTEVERDSNGALIRNSRWPVCAMCGYDIDDEKDRYLVISECQPSDDLMLPAYNDLKTVFCNYRCLIHYCKVVKDNLKPHKIKSPKVSLGQ